MPHSKTEHLDGQFDDGVGQTARLGMITLCTDIVSEYELARMAPAGDIAISSTRISMQNPVTMENLRRHAGEIGDAAAMFADFDMDAILYVCTSGTIAIGEEKIADAVNTRLPHAALTSPMIGAFAAFKTLNVRTLSFLTPYPDDVNHAMANAIEARDVAVVRHGSFHIDDDRDIARLSPDSIFNAALAIDAPEADAVFIPCASLRTSSILERLENKLNKPVISSHQAMLWHALRLAGYDAPIDGFGALMKQPIG